MYYFAFGIRRLHIPQIAHPTDSPFFFLSLISYTRSQILAVDVSDIAQKYPVLILSQCVVKQFIITTIC